MLFSTPLVRALRQAFPTGHLAYLCNRRTEQVLAHNPHLNELFVYEKDEAVRLWRIAPWQGLRYLGRLLARIRRSQFDYALDLSLGERYAFILKCLGLRRRIGFDYHRRGRFLTDRLPIDGYHNDHVVAYYRRLLRFVGVVLVDASLELHVSREDERWAAQWIKERGLDGSEPVVGVVPAGGVSWGADAPFRRWSLQGFAAVADTLIERYHARVILFGEKMDTALCQTVAQRMNRSVINLSGQTTLGQFVSLLGRLGLIICNDGGPLHIAVSQGVKTVSIFGPVDPIVYGPYGPATRHRVVTKVLPCRPCYHHFKLPPCPYNRACLNEVTVEDVLAAVDEMLT